MQTDLEFGTLIQNIRKQKGFEVRALAELVGVDASTISRIENLHTQPTVYTAFRICDGLGISLSDLVYRLVGKHLLPNNPTLFPIDTMFVVNLQEIDEVVREFKEQRQWFLHKMKNIINSLLDEYYIQGHEYLHKTPPYDISEIERYFLAPPFSEEYNLRYPAISGDYILQIYAQGGAIIPNDIEMYSKKKRTKSYLLPTSSVEKIKLPEILRFFNRKSEGMSNENIAGMIWEACKFLAWFDYMPQNTKEESDDSFGYVDDLYPPFYSRVNLKLKVATFYVTLRRWEFLVRTKGFLKHP